MIKLEIGHEVELEYGGRAAITGIIGKGIHDIVYIASYNGTQWALKWYDIDKLDDPEKMLKNLKDNVSDGAPNNKFMWPKYITKKYSDGSFGFLMEMKPESFEYLVDILKGYKIVNEPETGRANKKNVRFSSLFAMTASALNIVNAFRKLHKAEKTYQYLDDNGFFINADTGAILVGGCDHIVRNGDAKALKGGMPGYMAPELVKGVACPDINTDRYTLAASLFKLLFRGDPLEGRKVVNDICLTEEEILRHYGEDALFVYDPNDDSNRPVRGIHDSVMKFWETYPDYIKEVFTKAFTDGLNDPSKRVDESEWQSVLTRLRAEVIQCPMCGRTNFARFFDKADHKTYKCTNCREEIPTLEMSHHKWRTPVFKGAKIYECDIYSDSNDFLTVVGEVVENKLRPGVFGIKNCSDRKWKAKMKDGVFHDIEPGKGFPIWEGLEIDFGEVKAKM